MTARVVDLPRVAAALRALDVLVSEHPQLTSDDAADRCAEWLADEPPDGAENRDEHGAGDITGDVALSETEARVNRIDSGEAARSVLAKLDVALDKVNGNRAVMGAVMNRLDYIMDNLANVSMNTEASRSQIEDADYAKASTQMARTQIMQQAATAVLAQANMDQQTVLKLLQ